MKCLPLRLTSCNLQIETKKSENEMIIRKNAVIWSKCFLTLLPHDRRYIAINYYKRHSNNHSWFQLLVKISIFLNLCLLLYLSLSAGSKISLGSQPSHPHPAPLAEASLRENINKHEGDSDQKTKPGLSTEKTCDPPEIRPSTKFSLSENVSCLNKAIEFSQVGIK